MLVPNIDLGPLITYTKGFLPNLFVFVTISGLLAASHDVNSVLSRQLYVCSIIIYLITDSAVIFPKDFLQGKITASYFMSKILKIGLVNTLFASR